MREATAREETVEGAFRRIKLSTAWRMGDELAFIDGLGSWRPPDGRPRDAIRARRVRCLTGYLESLPARVHWFRPVDVELLRSRAEEKLQHAREHVL